jgi:hypothetical protein
MLPSDIIRKLQQEIGENLFYEGQSQEDMLKLVNLDYLTKTGYLESISSKIPARDGLPIPWITYPALHFLESTISTKSRILEIGGGSSTFFWSLRGNPLTYFEFDDGWNATLKKYLSDLNAFTPNIPINLLDLLSDKSRIELAENLSGELVVSKADFTNEFNVFFQNKISTSAVVMIDGHFRNYFLELCSEAQKDLIVVLDNADRSEYLPGILQMQRFGWNRIDFSGLGPINPYGWTTSVFTNSMFSG